MSYAATTELLRNSFVYGIGSVLQRSFALLMLPVLTHKLSTSDYGIAALLSLFTATMTGILSLGTGNSLGIMYFREASSERKQSLIRSNIAILAVNGTFWLLVVWWLAPSISTLVFQDSSYSNLIRISFIAPVLSTVSGPLLAFLRMEQRSKAHVIITVIGAVVTTASTIILVMVCDYGLDGFILAGTISQAVITALAFFVVGKDIPGVICWLDGLRMIRVGLPSVWGMTAFLVIDYGDRQLIERFLGLSALGVYAVGYSFGMITTVAVEAFASSWPPFFMKYVDKRDEATVVFSRVFRYYILFFSVVVVFFFSLAKPMTMLVTAPEFEHAWSIVGIVASSYALKGCYLIVLPGIYFAENLKWQSAIEWASAIVNLGLNILLIPVWGITGAAVATLLGFLCLPIFTAWISRKHLKTDFQWRRLTKMLVLLSAACAILFASSKYSGYPAGVMLATNLLFFLLYCVCTFHVILSLDEQHTIRAFFKK